MQFLDFRDHQSNDDPLEPMERTTVSATPIAQDRLLNAEMSALETCIATFTTHNDAAPPLDGSGSIMADAQPSFHPNQHVDVRPARH